MQSPHDANPAIRILVTGGTFDKEYDELSGKLFFRKTHIEEVLQMGRSRLPIEIENVCMMDSLDMEDSHRELILDKCLKSTEDKIVITHGTDTMEITARFLAQSKIAKTIVLTGAMVPYKFGSSDGLFNMGSALAFAQALNHGVYVAMNGRCFDSQTVSKDKNSGEFKKL